MKTLMRRLGMTPDPQSPPEIKILANQIQKFLSREPVEFAVADLSICGDFQKRVLLAERKIPRGKVCSYGELARILGAPRAARAVGTALARNPFPLIIPCHRAVRSDGNLGGFAGGLKMKRVLLEMEGVTFDSRGRIKRNHFLIGSEGMKQLVVVSPSCKHFMVIPSNRISDPTSGEFKILLARVIRLILQGGNSSMAPWTKNTARYRMTDHWNNDYVLGTRKQMEQNSRADSHQDELTSSPPRSIPARYPWNIERNGIVNTMYFSDCDLIRVRKPQYD
jgi:O-6-methylguanine DNA methyltransferase